MRASVLALCLLTALLTGLTRNPVAGSPPRHCEGLEIHFYENSSLAFDALRAGEADFIQWSLDYEQYESAISDPTLLLDAHCGGSMTQLDLNNNYTIADFPGVRNPLNEVTFRRALAHTVDKDWIIEEALKNFGERIDAPVGAAIMGYANQSVIGRNYPYPHSLTRAAELLDIHFADTDEDGTRNYPVGWPGRETGPNLDPIKFCIRSDVSWRLEAGRDVADDMRSLGLPVNQIEGNGDLLYSMVMDDMNYHIYTGGWTPGPSAPAYLYNLFHSSRWSPGGSNYNTGMNSSNLPNYPDLDEVLETVWYATDNEEFKAAVKKATGLLVADHCINIPLWGSKYWTAYRRNIVGIVSSDGYGLDNVYTFLNAQKTDDPDTPQDESQEPLCMGTTRAPVELNILCSSSYQDYAVLDRIFDDMLSVNPSDLSADQPWIAEDWEASKWYDLEDGKNKTKVTYWIRKDVQWHAPATGEVVRQFTAHDVEFTIWYIYPINTAWVWSQFKNVHHTKVVDDFTIEVYFDVQNRWLETARFSATGPLLPMNEYLPLLCGSSSASFYSDGTNCTESVKYVFADVQVVQVISADIDGTPLYEGVDYEIHATGEPDYTHNVVHFLANLTLGTVTIDYYTPTVDPEGYYLGDLDWTQTFYSIGPHYPVEIVPGTGGHVLLGCNPSHFLGAPALGEIDWIWYHEGTSKPRSGYYKVDLYDAVTLLKAYGSRGYGEPDPNWRPSADLDPYDVGHIGLFDAVIVLTSYGEKFGVPPD